MLEIPLCLRRVLDPAHLAQPVERRHKALRAGFIRPAVQPRAQIKSGSANAKILRVERISQ